MIGSFFQNHLLLSQVVVLCAATLLVGCGSDADSATGGSVSQMETIESKPQDSAASAPTLQPNNQTTVTDDDALFTDATEKVGLEFTHFNGMCGKLYFVETVGGGAALLDYDRDGDADIYITQGQMLGDNPVDTAIFPPATTLPLSDRLFRNDLEILDDGTRVLHFTDVTEEAGIQATGYGMGVTVGDYNRDGWPDLYVTSFGSNQLWQNNRQGGFQDVTKTAGVDDPRWSTSAAFVDYDRDGWLDLFICCYEDWSLASHRTCTNRFNGVADYCGPSTYQPERDRLFRNRGNGTFQDITVDSGISACAGAALGVVDADFNGDGFPDLCIANDGMANHYWINNTHGQFEEQAFVSGCAVNGNGKAEAGMGIDAGDFDNDGDMDIFMTHLHGETNTLYENDGHGIFADRSSHTGLGRSSTPSTGFGTVWLDYDLDGRLDLFVANGGVRHIPYQVAAGDPYPLKQPNQLFHQQEDFRFKDVSKTAGPAFEVSYVSRGIACGDVDNDGDPDIIVVNSAGPLQLLLNQHCEQESSSNWIGIDLLNRLLDGDVRGLRVELICRDGTRQWARMKTTAGYLSAHDPRIVFGLGSKTDVSAIRLHKTDGTVVRLTNLKINAYNTVDKL